ncbi:MAG TPA: YdhK family protein [Candidatus Jeotgalibaca pullicola]|nr:YdhK family protein [Candidatus Jeotgalibaca pullicola]
MKYKKKIIGLGAISAALLLAACSTNVNNEGTSSESASMSDMENHDMDEMVHDDSGEIPEGLEKAENSTFSVGDAVIIQQGHMDGMEGAEATVVGAFETYVYEISYDPTNGDPRVENHKWIIQEEILDAGSEPFDPGEEVTVEAKHMEGMEGATAIIDSVEETTVYMIDYKPTTGGETIKNHKWVTEEEIKAE